MKIVRRTSVVVEKLVVLAEWGEPDLIRLLDPDHPEYQGWTLDWYRDRKFVLTQERDYKVLANEHGRGKMEST